MKAHYRAFGGRLVIEVEGSTVKDLFQQIGPIAQVLDGDTQCGKCSSPNIYPQCREAQGYDYYELRCSDCDAKLSFGQLKDQKGLFAKRDQYPDTRGWHIYRALEAPEEPKQSAPPPAQPRPNGTPAPASAPKPPANLELEKLKLRCVDTPTAYAVYGELFDRLRAKVSEQDSDALWSQMLKRLGDPATKPASMIPVLEALHAEVVKQGC